MLKVKVKTEKFKLSIPLPYVLLSIGISIISSKWLRKLINEQIVKNAEDKSKAYAIPELDKRELKSIVSELRNHKGTRLVNVKAKDGTEVIVRL
ncbi:hypothetical protein [Sporosarcina highlanderae]|uniref:Uncharacterized protein n=1 Tax=Sporosarcina highlanderae TaxID=3035916 RepID=A0ABT8JLR3_9BACL|nr:hypothetical protein [Sporosarcina highlanderae]MDN4606099.1 hypothetical protein [Sporosarcina highlanderae]